MKPFSSRIHALSFAVVFFCAASMPAFGEEKETVRKYLGEINCKFTVTTPDGSHKLNSKTKVVYSFSTVGNLQDLILHRLKVDADKDGNKLNISMSRDEFMTEQNGQSKKIQRNKMSEELKKKIMIFDVPISHYEFDEKGRIVKREDVDSQLLKEIHIEYLVSCILFLHMPYGTYQNEWTTNNDVGFEMFSLPATLTFTKTQLEKSKQVVEISGTCNEGDIAIPGKQGFTAKNLECTITGRETYDESRNCWTEGDIVIEYASDLVNSSAAASSLAGKYALKTKEVESRSTSKNNDANPEEQEKAKCRTWTSADGKFTIEAKFIKADAENVTLEKNDGQTTDVPLKKLSTDDLEWIKKQPSTGDE